MNEPSILEILWDLPGDIWGMLNTGEKVLTTIGGAMVAMGNAAMLLEKISERFDRPDAANSTPSPYIPTDSQIEQAQAQADAMEKELQNMASSFSGDTSAQWKQQTQQALQRIQSYRHELFAPGAVQEISRALHDAESFTADGHAQAAEAAIYQAWQLARITQQQVLEGEKAWEKAAVDYLTIHGNLQTVFASLPETPVRFSTDCGEEVLVIDATSWSEGRIEAIQTAMPAAELPRDLPTEAVMQRIAQLHDTANTLRQSLTEAIQAFQDSQQRMEVCEAVYASLTSRGWQLEEDTENGFEGGDARRDAVLHLINAAGDKTSFTFSGANTITARAHFQSVYNLELSNYLETLLLQVLQENGLAVAQINSHA